jgi:hypothetical protein
MLLTHSIKVQFPDLHVQLRTKKALTIMASSIGEVLDIESPDSYIKRPTGPMVMVEVKDISKLAGIIRIPSMAEGAGPGDTTAQRIFYFGLPNQCIKCRKFGHLAKNCPLNRSPTQEGSNPAKAPPKWRGRNAQGRNSNTQHWNIEKTKGSMDQRGNGGTNLNKDHPSKGERTGRNPLSSGILQHAASKTLASGGEEEKEKNLVPHSHSHTRSRSKDVRMHHLASTQADKRASGYLHAPGSRIHPENQIVLCDLRAGQHSRKWEHGKSQPLRRKNDQN